MSSSRVALVTGSSRGIGRAIALELARQQWNLVINYRQDAAAANDVEIAIRTIGGQACVVQADVASEADRQRLHSLALDTFGHIDLLVNNAGMGPRQRVDLLNVTEESFDEVMQTNLKGPFFFSQRVARTMLEQIKGGIIPSGKIVNIGSISAYTASIERSEYCLSKAGLAMLTALFAARLAGEGVQVFEIRPGIIQTDMTRVATEKYDRLIGSGLTPIPRWGQPADVARAVAAIAQDAFPFSTGEIINIDGGFHLRRL